MLTVNANTLPTGGDFCHLLVTFANGLDPDLASGFLQASMSKIQGLFNDFSRLSYSFQGLKVYDNPELSVKILLQKC